jgi:transglutaminase-like putative cysteine protease
MARSKRFRAGAGSGGRVLLVAVLGLLVAAAAQAAEEVPGGAAGTEGSAAKVQAAAAEPAAVEATDPSIAEIGRTRYAVQAGASVDLPAGARQVRVWFAYPHEGDGQTVEDLETTLTRIGPAPVVEPKVGKDEEQADEEATEPEAGSAGATPGEDDGEGKAAEDVATPVEVREITDDFGNRLGFAEFAAAGARRVELGQEFRVERVSRRIDLSPLASRPLSEEERKAFQRTLEPTTYEMITPYISELAAEIRGETDNPAKIVRSLYDWSLTNLDIWLRAPERLQPSGFGSAIYAASTRSGDCRDLGSLFIALARASGVPARAVQGVLLRPGRGEGLKLRDGHAHCWVEAWVPGYDWVALDLVLGDLHDEAIAVTDANRADIERMTPGDYSGATAEGRADALAALDDRRFAWAVGRESKLVPTPLGPRPDSVAVVRIEVDGKSLDPVALSVRFREPRTGAASDD